VTSFERYELHSNIKYELNLIEMKYENWGCVCDISQLQTVLNAAITQHFSFHIKVAKSAAWILLPSEETE
jgi:hypothetical protein